MPDPVTGLAAASAVGSIGGGLIGADAQSDASSAAAAAQESAAMMSVEEQRRQFDAMQALLKPYTEAGVGSLTAQQQLLGLAGPEAQAAAIQGLETGQYQELAQQGENAMLQQAAATGGMRGGNIQGALAQYRPQLLNSLIQQQFSNLGGLTQIGQASAAGVGAAGMNLAGQIGQQYSNMGTAQAQNALTQGQIKSDMYSNLLPSAIGSIGGLLF